MIIQDALPDIPRWSTAVAEWGACLVYVVILTRRPAHLRRLLGSLALLLAGGGVLLGVQELAGRLPITLWILGMGLAVAVMATLLIISLRTTINGTIFLTARAFVLAELIASLHWQVRLFIAPDGSPPLGLEISLFTVVFGGGLALACVAEARHLPRGADLELRPTELVVSSGIAIGTFAMSNLSFTGIATPFTGRLGPEIFTIRTLVDLCGFVALYAQQQQRVEQRTRAESAAVHALLRSQHEQYEQSKRTLDEVDRKVHDMRHWIEAIRAEPDADRRSGFLDELEHRVDADARRPRTGNAVLDTILAAKGAACSAQHIQLNVVADGRLIDSMNIVDITSLVGNALDNAIEAAQQVHDRDRRHIKFALFAQNAFVMLRIENSYDGRMHLDGGRPITRKDDPARHGFGLTSIQRTAEQYGGNATFSTTDQWFTLHVLLPAVDAPETSA